jgi:IS30 family transposase
MKYLRPEPTLKRNDPDLPTCIIVDLDGTLALNTQKRSYYEPKPKEILNDELNKPIAKIVSALHKERLDLFFFSGRSNRYYEVTVEWLSSHNFIKEGSYDTGMTYKDLLMRKEGDSRSDATVKEEMYRNNIEDKYNVLCVIDDRPKVIRKWKDLGIFVLDVNQSGLDF